MFMIMEVNEKFSFAAKDEADATIPKYRSGNNGCGNFKNRCRKPNRAKNGS